MGRKKTISNYFGDKEEQAVVDYITVATKEDKNRIYNEILKPAFKKMIESIIRRYKLFPPNEIYEETFDDTLSFLMTKLDKFKHGKHKAYSYYGTICKHYLIGKIQTYNKNLIRNPSYETVSEGIVDNIKYINDENESKQFALELVENLVKKLKEMTCDDEEHKCTLKDSELKLGKALINLFENWDYVLTTDKSYKFNKSRVLLFLRDETGLNQKEIRDNMKKFKNEFYSLKNIMIE